MYPIVRKETLADNIILMDIKAPRVAAECLPGQFIIAKTDEVGERIPLTICDYDREKETVTIVVQTIGAGTERMMSLNEGDALEDFVGPLGCASELCLEENLEETKKKNRDALFADLEGDLDIGGEAAKEQSAKKPSPKGEGARRADEGQCSRSNPAKEE